MAEALRRLAEQVRTSDSSPLSSNTCRLSLPHKHSRRKLPLRRASAIDVMAHNHVACLFLLIGNWGKQVEAEEGAGKGDGLLSGGAHSLAIEFMNGRMPPHPDQVDVGKATGATRSWKT